MFKAYELYSYWITLYFILYFILIRNNISLPDWINPYPTIMFGTFIQFILTIISIQNDLPFYFIIGVVVWKLIILHFTINYIKKDYSIRTVLFNLILLVIYLFVLRLNNRNVFSIYKTVTSDKKYFDNFFKNRIKNII